MLLILILAMIHDTPNQKPRNAYLHSSPLFHRESLRMVMASRLRILPSPASPVSSLSLTLIPHKDDLCINEDDLWPEPVSPGEL
ncbi:hypothetical protein Bca4012_083076 [Brassica carinata]